MNKHNVELENEIINIINELRESRKHRLTYDDIDKNLFGKELMSESYEIVGVFCEIEKKFNISINENVFEKYGFTTISDIAHIVEECRNAEICGAK